MRIVTDELKTRPGLQLDLPLSQVFVPHTLQGGDGVTRCVVVGILSLLKDDTEGMRALEDKHQGLHT